MSFRLRRSDDFNRDFDLQYDWYLEKAGETVAERFFTAVIATLATLAERPGFGHPRKFEDARLKDIHSFRVNPPFDGLVIFYRYDATHVTIERLMRGSRDLPRRLVEPPDA